MRKDDPTNATFFRSGDRVFSQNGEWFYQTREGDQGPFVTREAAAADLKRYVNEKAQFGAIPYEKIGTSSGAGFSLADRD